MRAGRCGPSAATAWNAPEVTADLSAPAWKKTSALCGRTVSGSPNARSAGWPNGPRHRGSSVYLDCPDPFPISPFPVVVSEYPDPGLRVGAVPRPCS
jgi:hypothetical protein